MVDEGLPRLSCAGSLILRGVGAVSTIFGAAVAGIGLAAPTMTWAGAGALLGASTLLATPTLAASTDVVSPLKPLTSELAWVDCEERVAIVHTLTSEPVSISGESDGALGEGRGEGMRYGSGEEMGDGACSRANEGGPAERLSVAEEDKAVFEV